MDRCKGAGEVIREFLPVQGANIPLADSDAIALRMPRMQSPNVALAPPGNPDGVIDRADSVIPRRIMPGELATTNLDFSHGDMHPAGAPNEFIDMSDLLLIRRLL